MVKGVSGAEEFEEREEGLTEEEEEEEGGGVDVEERLGSQLAKM